MCYHPAALGSWPKHALHSAVAIGAGSRSYCSLKDILKYALIAESDLYPAFSCLAFTSLVVPGGLRLTCSMFQESVSEPYPGFALGPGVVSCKCACKQEVV